MNRSDLVRKVSRKTQMSQAQIEDLLETILALIKTTLASGETVVIKNFGRFEIRHRRPTVRRNPKTGEAIKVPEKRAVLFHPSPALKEGVQE